jgi:hypothetical protein
MPIYRYLCECGKQYDEFRKIDNRNDAPTCLCGALTELRIMGCNVQADNTDYISAALDKETGKRVSIRSRAQHREFLARNDYVEVGNEFAPPKRDDSPADAPMMSVEEMKKSGFVEEAF